MTNGVEPEQILLFMFSSLDLHILLSTTYPDAWDSYGVWFIRRVKLVRLVAKMRRGIFFFGS